MHLSIRHPTDPLSLHSQPRSGPNTSPAKCAHFHGAHHYLRRSKICQAVASDESVKDDVVQYKTSSTEAAFIAMCRKAYGSIAGWQSDRDWKDGDETYKGMVEVSRALMKVAAFPFQEHKFLSRNTHPVCCHQGPVAILTARR